jgi:hypothetical protein
MFHRLTHSRDFYAGLLLVLIGLFASVQGLSYGTGTLTQMGPGFLPVTLGVLLIGLGVVIAGGTSAAHEELGEQPDLLQQPEWIGWFCIIAAPALFIALGTYFGFIPAAFACVFVSALGDRKATVKSALALASITTAGGAILFIYILGVSFPLLEWDLPR